jgi:protein gp37
MQVAARFGGEGQAYEGLAYRNGSGAHWTGKVRLVEAHLEDPLRWKRPRRIFVNSMSDLFHPLVLDQWIEKIFNVMYAAKQHTFQILTKRPERMLDWISRSAFLSNSPLDNVWLGVSVEDQKTADERIPLLLNTPAAVRWVSAEPLLGEVKLSQHWRDYLAGWDSQAVHACGGDERACLVRCPEAEQYQTTKIDWIVVGGESGPGARPMRLEWARSIVGECTAARVPVFVKQLGAHPVLWRNDDPEVPPYEYHFTDRKGGNIPEWPEDLRVREYPRAERSAAA